MSSGSVVPLLKFSPAAQRPEVLEALTVQREPLIADLVDAALDVTGGLRHHLLVGPRGMGKSHVLTLIRHRIKSIEDADGIIVAWLEEDPWAVRTYGKFLASIASAIGSDLADSALIDLAAEYRSRTDPAATSECQAVICAALGDRRLVLLAENLEDVFRRIGVDGQSKFRAFVENWQHMLVIATTPQLFVGVSRHPSTFYGFFRITHLDELSLPNAAELLRRVARLRGANELEEFLRTDHAIARLRAVEALAGGHPRVWLLLAGCLSVAAIDELVPLFLETLDDLTPYYQDRLRDLGDQQQEIIILLSETGGALSNRALSARSGLPQNQIAATLSQLAERGYVRRAVVPESLNEGDRRMSYWELREPLMRLCLDVKRSRGEPIRVIVAFLKAWYGARLLDELVRLPPGAELAAAYATEAVRGLEGRFASEELLIGSSREIVARADQGLALMPTDSSLMNAKAVGLMLERHAAQTRDILQDMIDTQPDGVTRVALRLRLAQTENWLGEKVDTDELLSSAMEMYRTHPDDSDCVALVGFGLLQFAKYEEALTFFEEALELAPKSPAAHHYLGLALDRLGRYPEALAAQLRACALAPNKADYHDMAGLTSSKLGRHEAALLAFDRAAELDPQTASYHHNRGLACARLDRYDEALSAFDRALRLDEWNAAYHDDRGFVLSRLGRHEETVQAFTAATARDPHVGDYHDHRGMALVRLNKDSDAIEAFARATELAPTNPHFHYHMGLPLFRCGRHDEALDAYARAIQLAPTDPNIHTRVGTALAQRGYTAKALEAVTRATDLAPANAGQHDLRGRILSVLGRDLEALRAYERACGLAATNAMYHDHRGIALARLARDEEALAAYDSAVQLAPAIADYANHQGLALARLERHEDALRAFERATELAPDKAEHHDHRGLALSRLRRHGDALAAHRAALQAAPGEAAYHHHVGMALSRLRRDEEALLAYARAAELDPREPAYQDHRGSALSQLGRHEDALIAYTAASDLAPGHADYHDNRGYMLSTLGRHADALNAYTTASKLAPQDAWFHRHRGVALSRLGRYQEALEAYEQAIAIAPSVARYHNSRADALRGLGDYDEALQAVASAIELDGSEPIFRFTAFEIALDQGDDTRALSDLHDALMLWKRGANTPPGDTETICRILWSRPGGTAHRRRLITKVVQSYADTSAAALAHLGRGLVHSVALVVEHGVAAQEADAWVEDWRHAAGAHAELAVPLALLVTGQAWKSSPDRAHLLALPPEQRSILMDILDRG